MNRLGLTLIVVLLAPGVAPRAQQPPAAAAAVLKPTSHPRLPGELSQLWLAPVSHGVRTAALSDFAIGVKLEVDSNFAKAPPTSMHPPARQGVLAHYAEYYQGLAELRLGRASDARHTFQQLQAK